MPLKRHYHPNSDASILSDLTKNMTTPLVRIIVAACIEVAYAVFTRTWLRRHMQGVELEPAVTGLRALTVVVYLLLFRTLIRNQRPRSAPASRPLLIAGALLVLVIPFLFRGWNPGGGFGTALVFALTSVVVGLREELLYRAVLLNLLEPRFGSAQALLISTILFVVYHYGALPISALTLVEVAAMSLILGIIYLKTRSLFAVVALHSLYDGIWFFGPYIDVPLHDSWRVAFLLSGVAIVVVGAWPISEPQPDATDDGRAFGANLG